MPDITHLKKFIEKNFSHFGINKKNEILRLLYEISKREKTSFLKIADDLKDKNFTLIKKYLLKEDTLILYLQKLILVFIYQN